MDPCSLSVAPASLLEAIDHADAVISKAAGYTRHNKGDIDKIDTIGNRNRNLADAASQAGVRRFVLTQHPDMRPDRADSPPRARTALRRDPRRPRLAAVGCPVLPVAGPVGAAGS